MLRKIAVAAASKPAVEITQEGETLSIRTSTSVRTTNVTFTVGESFNEITVDGRPCTVHTHTHAYTHTPTHACIHTHPFIHTLTHIYTHKNLIIHPYKYLIKQTHTPNNRIKKLAQTPT